ncbi:ABC transporter ATP-binding protein [Actinomadura graeca]|uniref:ABC transporter ATP-binding protein n=1 Tax=Actinomadura graeca TaxID=2750812 RepID=A0ABX8QUH9_9ACTN|nr:ABC transporter ATP-binding protein [Actinomadura graeca]QXJ22480.1 ABC transporter ATP-binding protein [Actinomadura graeca]
MNRPDAVRAEGLRFRYGGVAALDGLDLAARTAEITAVLGPNGAGKTTFLRQVCGLAPVQDGTLTVLGRSIGGEDPTLRRDLGVVFQEPTLDAELTVMENLVLHGRLFGMSRSAARSGARELLGGFGLDGRSADRVRRLSGGLARRVELVRALLHRPRLLVLDEPTAGLDPEARAVFWSDVRAQVATAGTTVLFSTHYMDEAEVSDRVHVVAGGRAVASGSPLELRMSAGSGSVHLAVDAPGPLLAVLGAAGILALEAPGGVLVPHRDPAASVHGLCVLAARHGLRIDRVELRQSSLEEVFLSCVAAS